MLGAQPVALRPLGRETASLRARARLVHHAS